MKNKIKKSSDKRIEKVYRPEVIPDKTDELAKKAEKARIRLQKQRLTEKRHREKLRQKRILASEAAGKDKFMHTIDFILEQLKYQKAVDLSIDFNELNFENTINGVRTLMGWLEELKEFGALRNFSKQNYTGGVRIYLKGCNTKKLKQYKNQMGISLSDKGKLKLPPDTQWEDITIRFLNGDEVLMQAKGLRKHSNYEEMGFLDKRTKSPKTPNKPNKQWLFLKGLSENRGKISWRNSNASAQGKKHKQLLSQTLKEYFGIDTDPFYSYKKEGAYKIKINLIPEMGGNENIKESDLEKFYREQVSEVYDPYE